MKEKSLGDFALLRGMRQDLKRMTVLEGEAEQVLFVLMGKHVVDVQNV